MTCHDAREQLSALLDDALSLAERQALEAHLAACAECRRELDAAPRDGGAPGPPPAGPRAGRVRRPGDGAGLSPAVAAAGSSTRCSVPLRVKLPLEAAAVLLVGVSALYVYQRTPEVQQVARQEAPVAPAAAPPAPPASTSRRGRVEPKGVPARARRGELRGGSRSQARP